MACRGKRLDLASLREEADSNLAEVRMRRKEEWRRQRQKWALVVSKINTDAVKSANGQTHGRQWSRY